jgi:prepilin-type N-terminal cleavage/methylation domain-containing protein
MKRRKALPSSRQAGLTLIELMIGIAISSVLVTGFLTLYAEGQKYFFNQNAHSTALEDSRLPMAEISRDVRGAALVSDAVVEIDGKDYQTSADCLVLEFPSTDGTGGPISGHTDYVIYTVSGGRLLKVVQADEAVSSRPSRTRVLADAVNAFGLGYFGQDGLTPLAANFAETFVVDISLASATTGIQRGGRLFVEPLNTQAKLRNKVAA